MKKIDDRVAYDRWVAAPFPEGSDDDVLDELHAHLAYVDALVADAAFQVANGFGSPARLPQQARRELHDVAVRAGELEGTEGVAPAEAAKEYREYAQLLEAVIDAFSLDE